MRVCIVYDCLYPYTIGGAERWYRSLAERLAATGAEVTYLTLRQWERGAEPVVPGVRVVAVGPKLALYTRSGRRRVLPPLLFGLGVLVHLLRHGGRYDVVHTASFPYFSLLAAGVARRRGGFRLIVDWHEVWTRAYWEEYLGPLAGRVGWRVQRMCLRVPQRAFCFSRLHERRLRELGLRGEPTLLEGQYTEHGERRVAEAARPVAVFAGRFIPEKRVPALVPALAQARKQIPDLRGELYGDGPDREAGAARDRGAAARRLRSPRPASSTPHVLEQALCVRALPPSRLPARGLRPRRRRSRCPRRAHRRRRGPGQRGDRARRGGRERSGRALGGGRRARGRDRPRPSRRATSSVARRSTGSAATRTASPSIGHWRRCSRCMPTPERSVLHVLPHPGGGGETYVDLLGAMPGYRFDRISPGAERDAVGRPSSGAGWWRPFGARGATTPARSRRGRERALPSRCSRRGRRSSRCMGSTSSVA